MKPKVTILSMITQDAGYVSGLLDVDLYYEAGHTLGADAVIVGADSLLVGLEDLSQSQCDETFPKEKSHDCSLPWLVITDSRARLIDKLSYYRNMEYIRDVLVLVSKKTPQNYVNYLEKNAYLYYMSGDDRCDLASAFDHLSLHHGIKHVRVDAVGSLAASMLNDGLVDELCVINAPYLLQSPSLRAFDGLKRDVRLLLISSEPLRNGYFVTRYTVER